MAYSIKKNEIIKYPPKLLRTYVVGYYEWIDNLNFTLDPKDCLENAEEYIKIVKEKFLEAGWYGDGKIELMWIPPFMFDEEFILQEKIKWEYGYGITIWHVKQLEDGISWLLFPKELFKVPNSVMLSKVIN